MSDVQVIVTPAAKRRTRNYYFAVCVADATGAARDLPGVDRYEANAVAAARLIAHLHARVWVEKRAS